MDVDEIAMPYSARAARQRRIAAQALPTFGLADASYQLIKLGTTTTFRVEPRKDQPCVLRLQRLSRMPFGVVQSEVRWLADIREHTPLLVPAPLPALDGELAVLLPALPGGEHQIAALFAWLPGRQKQRLTLRDAELIGESLAILHLFSNNYRPSGTFARWDFDCAAFVENASVLDQVGATFLSPATIQLIRDAIGFVELSFVKGILVERSNVLRTFARWGLGRRSRPKSLRFPAALAAKPPGQLEKYHLEGLRPSKPP